MMFTPPPSTCLVLASLALTTMVAAQSQPTPAPRPGPAAVTPAAPAAKPQRLQFTAAPLGEVIELYQQLTKKRIVRDPKVESVTVTIETSGPVSQEEAIEFIDKSLLLAGYAFVPSGENMLKIIAFDGGKVPSSEGVPMVLSAEALPQTDQIVSFVLPLNHLDAEEAAQAFAQIIPPHSYGKITPVPNARALVITENSNTIRAYIILARQVDVPPGEIKHKSIPLERADAEEVAEALGELLGLNQSQRSAAPPPSRRQPAPPPAGAGPGRPVNAQQAAAREAAQVDSAAPLGTTEAESVPPKIRAIQRTNTLLIIARPLDLEYIESLVKEFDAASPQRTFVSRKLRYLKVLDFLDVARNALLRGARDTSEGTALPAASNATTASTVPASSGNRGFGGGVDGSGYGGGGSGFGSMGFGASASTGSREMVQPHSVLIGKTLLIGDPAGSQFFASGPPEQLRILSELAEELDKRPRQILLTAVIGEFTLGDDFSFGLDWLRTLESVGRDGLVGGALNTTGGTLPDFNQFGGIEDFVAPQGLAVYGHIGRHLNVFLRTLEQTRRFHVLQKPTVTALNHELASIYIGQQLAIPGQTLTTGNTGVNGATVVSNTQYVPVRLQLDITPHIYANDEVRLDFSQQNMDVSSFTEISGNRVPNLSEQGMRNTIIVPDNTTVMLGGLITERDTRNKSGLPFLVRVPVLKHLFGSTSKAKERRELMIFVQPHILESGADHLEAQARWVQGTESYPANREFTDPSVPPDAAGPRGSGTGGRVVSPLLPLPTWPGDDTPAARAAREAAAPAPPPEATPKTRALPRK